jgi:radical SAM superfamily enzyme YgiQ (UPF0313 family)
MIDALEALRVPWWCYARADTLARFAAPTWEKLRRSQLKMVYVGAESGSDAALAQMKKGSRVEHTVELVRRCREHGVVPELSFMLGGPEDPEGEIESTFSFIRRIKASTLKPRSSFTTTAPRRSDGAGRPARRALVCPFSKRMDRRDRPCQRRRRNGPRRAG